MASHAELEYVRTHAAPRACRQRAPRHDRQAPDQPHARAGQRAAVRLRLRRRINRASRGTSRAARVRARTGRPAIRRSIRCFAAIRRPRCRSIADRPTVLYAPTWNLGLTSATMLGDRLVDLIRAGSPGANVDRQAASGDRRVAPALDGAVGATRRARAGRAARGRHARGRGALHARRRRARLRRLERHLRVPRARSPDGAGDQPAPPSRSGLCTRGHRVAMAGPGGRGA